ncbi:MAG: hypothetical protein AAGD13_00840 [Pseudomonadota bacterium]
MRVSALALAGGSIVVLAVVAGLATIGGPGQARLERLDRSTVAAMNSFVRKLECRSHEQRPERLPATLDDADLRSYCAHEVGIVMHYGQAAVSPSAIRYNRKSDQEFELCGKFNDLSRLTAPVTSRIDRQTGCIQGRLGG